MRLTALIQLLTATAIKELAGLELDADKVLVQRTSSDFEGHYTVVLFPLLKLKLGSPEVLAAHITPVLLAYKLSTVAVFASTALVKGFLNIMVADTYWRSMLAQADANPQPFFQLTTGGGQRVMVEFSSPNTNKPLHLGHLRNNFLGDAVCNLLAAVGYRVVRTNLVNDRGIHICKSMYAWQQWGAGEQPTETLKGDHLVGKYYVRYDQENKREVAQLIAQGMPEEEAKRLAPTTLAVQEMLRRWEAGDQQVRALWSKLNGWVYDGFALTYQRMGIKFDQYYYESDTYLLGKEVIEEGLGKGVFFTKPDGSVWVDLTAEGLDEKLLLRGDGTSVYITQDLGTADKKYADHPMVRSVYVIGNEQDYHMRVLIAILRRLGRPYAAGMYHLSYGMVELPSGRMKSREGTVVDADDLMEEVVQQAAAETTERGKVQSLSPQDQATLHEMLGLGALKFYLLKVAPHKKMLFDPAESVSLQGDTGPFVQYTHARISSLLQKAQELNLTTSTLPVTGELHAAERALAFRLYEYLDALQEAAQQYDPSHLALYLLDLAKDYNRLYYELPILSAPTTPEQGTRLQLSRLTLQALAQGLALLGMQAPSRM